MFLKKKLALLMEHVPRSQIFTKNIRAPCLCVTKRDVKKMDLSGFSESCNSLILRLQNSRVNAEGLRGAGAGRRQSLWEDNVLTVLTLGLDALNLKHSVLSPEFLSFYADKQGLLSKEIFFLIMAEYHSWPHLCSQKCMVAGTGFSCCPGDHPLVSRSAQGGAAMIRIS